MSEDRCVCCGEVIPEGRMVCPQCYGIDRIGIRDVGYQSPIELFVTNVTHQICKQEDEEIYKAVVHFVPNVDKEELLKALKYDRGQYEKGFRDGKRAAAVYGHWDKPEVYGMGHKFNNLGVVCSACTSWSDNPYNFCPHCGADMGQEEAHGQE